MASPPPWNLVASAYAEEVVPMFETFARRALELAPFPRGARVVDVACGPGTLAALAAQLGARVDAIDFSPAMLEQCQARLRALGLSDVTARLGDGQALPYEAGTYAAAFSMFGLMFFPDRAKGFAELRRVLAPGGRAVVSSWTRIEDTPAMAAMFGALRETMSRLVGPGAPQPGSQEMPLATEDACRAEMGAAFRDVTVVRAQHTLRYDSAEALFSSIERTMAPIALLKSSLGERWRPLHEAATAAIRSACGEGERQLTMTALLSTGVA
jgi:SAM-dependent methyltransferase